MAESHPGARAAVVGGVNIDIGGRPELTLIMRDSNPGSVNLSAGGVGFNIACGMALLGLKVTLLTALGQDAFGEKAERACGEAGIDLSRALRTAEDPTSVYLFIADGQGEMQLAISDMEICRRITPDYLERNRDVLDGASAVVFDTNIPEESVRWLAENCRAPLFADPVSVAKGRKLKEFLGRIDTLKPNRLEAEQLSGVPIRTEEDLAAAADALLEAGTRRVFITLGSGGVYAAEKGRKLRVPCFPARVRSMTGAGDAFMAGLVYSRLAGADLEESARTASAAACIAVESEKTINPELSVRALRERMGPEE